MRADNTYFESYYRYVPQKIIFMRSDLREFWDFYSQTYWNFPYRFDNSSYSQIDTLFSKKKLTTAPHGHGQTRRSFFSSTRPPIYLSGHINRTYFRRSFQICKRISNWKKSCIIFQPSKVSAKNWDHAAGESPPQKMHLLTINFFPPTNCLHH